MGKAFGIAAFVILLMSIPIPVLGIWLAFIAVLLGTIAGFMGEKTWAIVVSIVGFVVLFWLSPAWYLVMFPPRPFGMDLMPGLYEHNVRQGHTALIFTLTALSFPLIGALATRARERGVDPVDEPGASE